MRLPEHVTNSIRKNFGKDKKMVAMFFNSIFLSIDAGNRDEDDMLYQIEDKYNISITIMVSNTINEDIYMIAHEILDETIEKNESSAISIDTVYENDSDEKEGAKKIKNKKNSVSGSRNRKKSSKPSTSTSKIQKSELEKDEIKIEEKKPSLKNTDTRKKPESKKKEIKKSPQASPDKKN